ncbi:hypothetical protein GR183_20150 [Stappia sp. GBMRC 2046]|uniref:Glucose-methanol-choline oxidoreductase C-terminal domain-containing protein n=1 Tax=Stappia sediminis TaxID=2692190 RepID=A0A7X3LY28_9HYPH|nr:GMC family oxidoreductase [Stappia sediminis]MXN67226.1 hypothetical protein [Stappia sediminis]
MFIDANELADNAQLDCEICIIGAGPAGIVLADGLGKMGLQICLTEAGGLLPQSDHAVPSVSEQLNHSIIVHPRTRYFGGMSNAWGGVRGLNVGFMPLDPIDFEKRPWVPNSGWPISYQELKPFYERACSLVNELPSEDFDAQRHSDHLLAAFDDDVFRSCMTYLVRPIRFGKQYQEALGRAQNVRVLLNSYATEIEECRSEHGISLIHSFAKGGKKHRLSAGIFVLACGGLETTRLLLASKRKHACGVGNQNDLVGRYYMQHPKGSHGHIALRKNTKLKCYVPGLLLKDRLLKACISLTNQRQRREELLNHRVVLAPLLQLSGSHAARRYGELRALWSERQCGKAFRMVATSGAIGIPKVAASTCRNIISSLSHGALHYRVINHMEQLPEPSSRIELSRETNRFGVPLLRTRWRIGDAEKKSLCRFHELLGQNLSRYKIGSLQSRLDPQMNSWPVLTSSSHDLGTTRMHSDPRYGVTDANGGVHGLRNLYIIGGALFPTGGHANPTLTIIALALRMVAHLAVQARMTPRLVRPFHASVRKDLVGNGSKLPQPRER